MKWSKKKWVSLEQAEALLSEETTQKYTHSDIVQLVVENQLEVYWQLPHKRDGWRVEQGTIPGFEHVDNTSEVRFPTKGSQEWVGWSPIDGKTLVLDGVFKIDLEINPHVRDWLRTHYATGREYLAEDGVILKSKEGDFYQRLGDMGIARAPNTDLPELNELVLRNEELQALVQRGNSDSSLALKGVTWDQVSIELRAGNRLAYRISNGPNGEKSLGDIGLLNKKNDLTKSGVLLVGLSQGRRYPSGQKPSPAEKSTVSKLRKALKMLTGITADPIEKFAPDNGYLPLFELLDRRNAADKRAEERAVHVPYEDEIGAGYYNETDQSECEDEYQDLYEDDDSMD